jgi:hypothetical protein
VSGQCDSQATFKKEVNLLCLLAIETWLYQPLTLSQHSLFTAGPQCVFVNIMFKLLCSYTLVTNWKLAPGFCFADVDERQNTCLWWRGYVHISGKGADFETVHIRRLHCVQEGLFSGWHVPYALIALSQLFSSFKRWKVCVKYTVLQKLTLICWRNLISNFCYMRSINNKAENEHQMACNVCVCVCVCCCCNMKILLGTVLKFAAFPQILQPVDKQGKSWNNVFSVAPYGPHL